MRMSGCITDILFGFTGSNFIWAVFCQIILIGGWFKFLLILSAQKFRKVSLKLSQFSPSLPKLLALFKNKAKIFFSHIYMNFCLIKRLHKHMISSNSINDVKINNFLYVDFSRCNWIRNMVNCYGKIKNKFNEKHIFLKDSNRFKCSFFFIDFLRIQSQS